VIGVAGQGGQAHFDTVAGTYRALRRTDDAPTLHIADRLPRHPVVAVDVGAGTGRYTERLREVMPEGSLVCAADLNAEMLTTLTRNETAGDVIALRCGSEQLPLADHSVDVLTSFNSVHHFDLDRFVGEAIRVLKPDGDLFVYTRTPAQNAASIWGRQFPGFAARETRLLAESELQAALGRLGHVQTTSFRFTRHETPARLAQQVRGRHYSTFSLYENDELTAALDQFLGEIDGTEAVVWEDQNLLAHARSWRTHAHPALGPVGRSWPP
jgi:ubiquinone/menaquinone biosynthesis C-methylase UbiE